MLPSLWIFIGLSFGGCVATSCWRTTNCTGPVEAAFPGPWESNIFAPSTRFVNPKSILTVPGANFVSEYKSGVALRGTNAAVVFDFGVEVGGIVSVNYTLAGSAATLGLAFTESNEWIGTSSDNSSGSFKGPDSALTSNITTGTGSYVMPDEYLRGGFRYLTIFLTNSSTSILTISDVSLEISFAPTWVNLRAYQGYFDSSDEELNEIWYSGAHTLQSNAVPPSTGRHSTDLKTGWENNAILGPGQTIIVDGAKRDRWVWIGDMGIAVPSSFVSIGDMESVRNALQIIYDYQASNGAFPESGTPYVGTGSDTYHMWAMIGTYNYVLYTNDLDFLALNWAKYLLGMQFISAKVNSAGLLNATGTGDWGRTIYGTNGSEPNMLLFRTLQTGAMLAFLLDPYSSSGTNLTAQWLSEAESLQMAIMKYLWDDSYGAFRDTPTKTNLYPQDGNSMAVAFGVVLPDSDEAVSISDVLLKNWGTYGPSSPELPGNVSPFISGFEIQAHYLAGQPSRALDLMRLVWGWYLHNPNGTQSTVIEGYTTSGTFEYRGSDGYHNDASYTSHSHGWSSGPTSGLTTFTVGLQVTRPAGQTWQLKPMFGGLSQAQGGFSTPLGKFSAGWVLSGNTANIWWDTPEGTTGLIDIPLTTPYTVAGGQQNITAILPCTPRIGA